MAEQEFSHLDGDGRLRMVDVSGKETTRRVAQAGCLVVTRANAEAADQDGRDAILSARLCGVQAAKRTADLIPLCHPLALTDVQVDVAVHPRGYEVSSTVVTLGRTGVEMEALSACTFAALALVAALVGRDRDTRVEDLVLRRKSGGKSGDWGRDVTDPA